MTDTCYIQKQPYGVVFILGAWNYPLQLCLCPLAGAIAGGNCVLLKPSEVSSHTEQFLMKRIPEYLDKVRREKGLLKLGGGLKMI